MSWQNRVQIISNIEISYRLDGCYTKNIRILHNIIIVMYYTVKKKKITAKKKKKKCALGILLKPVRTILAREVTCITVI